MAFGDHLKDLRERAGMTQATMSATTGLSLGVVRDYEQGRKEPSFRSALKLAIALGVSLQDLATGLQDEGKKSKAIRNSCGWPRRKAMPSMRPAAELELEAAPKKPRGRQKGK